MTSVDLEELRAVADNLVRSSAVRLCNRCLGYYQHPEIPLPKSGWCAECEDYAVAAMALNAAAGEMESLRSDRERLENENRSHEVYRRRFLKRAETAEARLTHLERIADAARIVVNDPADIHRAVRKLEEVLNQEAPAKHTDNCYMNVTTGVWLCHPHCPQTRDQEAPDVG